jgi:hypothetical protein
VTPLERALEIRTAVEALVAAIKRDTAVLTVADARVLHSEIRECIGWLQSANTLLEPGEVL